MAHFSLIQICAAALVMAAAMTDLRSRRIPNWLTLAGLLSGLVLHTAISGLQGFGLSLLGMLLGFGCYFLLYCLRAMGAGDVKLMAAVGAMVGPRDWLSIFVATAIAGGVLGLALAVRKRRTRQTFWNMWFIVTELLQLRLPYQRRGDLDVRDSRALNMPHAVAIASGTLMFLLAGRFVMGHFT
jgi:prepilin peptidase CpaA